jgi:hypothetical protein
MPPEVRAVREAEWVRQDFFHAVVWTADLDWITYTYRPPGGWFRWGYADKPMAFIGVEEVPPEVVARFNTSAS